MPLGDSFPLEQRLETFQRSLRAGTVFYLFCDFTTPPKEKYLLLACIRPAPLFLIINSEVPEFYLSRSHLRDRQVQVLAAEHGFLSHDSFVDCTKTFAQFSLERLQDQVLSDIGRIKGEISPPARAAVIKAVLAARTIEVKYKQWMLKELELGEDES